MGIRRNYFLLEEPKGIYRGYTGDIQGIQGYTHPKRTNNA
jgi:hypothetical protein